ncbi:MAG TPA: hypothetical protein VMH83_05165, partial [Candidatus Acidoferrum sp.]|nr:hypothetical protein [Candidatus Acidoferrum sp.]
DLAAFGVAPVVGVIAWTLRNAPDGIGLSLLCCCIYLACAVLRLAYFNVRHAEGLHDFIGLPTTEASVGVAAVFLLPALSLPVLLGTTGAMAVAMVAPFTIKRPHWTLIALLVVLIMAVMIGLLLKGM